MAAVKVVKAPFVAEEHGVTVGRVYDKAYAEEEPLDLTPAQRGAKRVWVPSDVEGVRVLLLWAEFTWNVE